MKQYLLDTCIVAFMLRGRKNVLNKLLEVGSDNCHISEITYVELLQGAKCSKRTKDNLKILNAFVKDMDILPISNALNEFADVKFKLRKMGKMVEDADIFIGATAIVNDLVMVTDNTQHFENMPGITFENWVERDKKELGQ